MITQRDTLTGITFDKDGTIHANYSVEFLGDEGQVIGQGMGPTIISYPPGADLKDAEPKVAALAHAAWTDDVMTAYQAKVS